MKNGLRIAAAVLAAAVLAPGALAQAFPARPVKIIVPFSVGSAADIAARRLGQGLSEAWGQGVVIENIAGAAGNIGAVTAAKAAPDGHTLLMLGLNHAINPSLYKDVGYDLGRDFKPIARVGVAPLAIVANPGLGAASIQQLITTARSRRLFYGSGGSGSVTHLAVELLKTQAGIPMTHVPYKSIAPMVTDILGNQISLGAPAAASVLPQVRAGTLKVLAVTTAKRSAALPNVPTVAESGLPGYDVSTWNGLLAPAGTPDAVIEKIHGDVVRVARSREFTEQLQQQAMDVDLLGPAAFGAFLKTELEKWARLVKDSGARLD